MNVFDLMATISLDTSGYEQGLQTAKKDTQSLSSSLKSAVKPLVAVGAAGAAAGGILFGYASKTANAADRIDKMSQKLGFSTDAFQEWDYVLELSGASIDSMQAGVKTLTNKFDEAINGSASAAEMFNKLGLKMEDIKDLSREDLFAKVIEGFQGMEDSAERAALANDLLGRSGAELAPLFNTTSEETKELMNNLHEMGGVMSEDAVKDGAKFNDSMTSMKKAFGGAANSIAKELLPAFTKLMDKVTKFVQEGGLTKILTTLKKLTPVIAGAISAMVAYKTAMGITAVITALTKATEGQTIAQTLLNAVMNANPFVLVATLVAGLATALITLWHTNDGFREAVTEAWEAIKAMFSDFFNAFITAVQYIPTFLSEIWDTITGGIKNAFNAIAEFFSNIWSTIKGTFIEALDGIKSTVSGAFNSVKETITNIWTSIKETIGGFLGDIWDAITGKFTEIKETVADIFTNIWEGITGRVKDIVDAITGGVGDAIDFLKELPGKALEWGHDLIANFVKGIKDKISDVGDAVGSAAKTVKKFLGFSEPEEGPLSNFHTFAPDMIDLFTKGIYDNLGELENASDSFATAMMPERPSYTGLAIAGAGAGSGTQEQGDIIIPIYIGEHRLDEVLVTAEQLRNYRSGGR